MASARSLQISSSRKGLEEPTGAIEGIRNTISVVDERNAVAEQYYLRHSGAKAKKKKMSARAHAHTSIDATQLDDPRREGVEEQLQIRPSG